MPVNHLFSGEKKLQILLLLILASLTQHFCARAKVQDSISRQKISSSWTTRSSLLNSGAAARRLKVQTYGGGRKGRGRARTLHVEPIEPRNFILSRESGSWFVRSVSVFFSHLDRSLPARKREGKESTWVRSDVRRFPLFLSFLFGKVGADRICEIEGGERGEKRRGR